MSRKSGIIFFRKIDFLLLTYFKRLPKNIFDSGDGSFSFSGIPHPHLLGEPLPESPFSFLHRFEPTQSLPDSVSATASMTVWVASDPAS
jgi:hypothetical protein